MLYTAKSSVLISGGDADDESEHSMARRLAALIFIFCCTTVAWIILGGTIMFRTEGGDSGKLRSKVGTNWGVPQTQAAPSATWTRVRQTFNDFPTENGKTQRRQVEVTDTIRLPLDASNVNVALNLEHRQKGL